MQTAMACTGRKWWDFVSFDPRLPENLSYKCIRFYRDTEMVQSIENEVIRFLAELDEMVGRLKNIKGA